MKKKAVRFVQIETSTNHIYGLDREGNVWYRSLIPYSSTTGYYPHSSTPSRKETEAKENEMVWKSLAMEGRVPDPPGEPLETVPIDKPADGGADKDNGEETTPVAPKQIVDENPGNETVAVEARPTSVGPAPAEIINLPITVREARALPESRPSYGGKGGWD